MSKTNETLVSNCEKAFVIQAIKQNTRLDGRTNDEFRKLKINYGADWGGALVALGETKVLAQVSCELGEPKATRPNEGLLHINVELGPMAAPHFEADRSSDLAVQISRTLERTFKDSRCVDLESLCITSDEHVWILRVDINILNHAGNLTDCCSIATLCALAHFRRPDVSLIDDDIIIHTADEKEYIPMVIHHYPICVTYVIYDNGRIAVADPTLLEETTSESQMVFGFNSFQELCCLNLAGLTLPSTNLLLQYSKCAANYAKNVVDMIKKSLETDFQLREENKEVGFADCISKNHVTVIHEDRLPLKLKNFTFNNMDNSNPSGLTPMTVEDNDTIQNNDEECNSLAITTEKDFSIAWMPEETDLNDENNSLSINAISDCDYYDDGNDENVDDIVKKTLDEVKPFDLNQLKLNISNSDSEEEETITL